MTGSRAFIATVACSMITSPLLGQGAGLSRARAATVVIQTEGLSGKALGSGVIIGDNGLIVTNAHVIEGARRVTVKLPNGIIHEATGAFDYDPRLDLAIIQIPAVGLQPIEFGNSDSVAVGQRLMAIGAPEGLEATVTDGILSAVRVEDGIQKFQVSVPISHGSSGGAITDEKGRLIALAVSGIRGNGAENLNFAIPINYIRGKLTIISQKSATPFAQLQYAGPSQSSQTTGAAAVAVVNQNLGLDFTVLDGAILIDDQKTEGQTRSFDYTSYSISNTPGGSKVLERVSSNRFRNQGLVASCSGSGFLDTRAA